MNHCCPNLAYEIENGSSLANNKKVIIYNAKMRSYGLTYDGTLRIYQPIEYCPFCGRKFTKDLIEEYWETIIDELGPEYYPTDENYDPNRPLPEEFKTDEWWKKRGL